MSKKTKLAFWLNSHCKTDSKREEYVKSLRKHINIDIYGKCGPLKYSKFNYSAKYQDMFQGFEKLAPKYKFYFAFENSICHDYITGDFFKKGTMIHPNKTTFVAKILPNTVKKIFLTCGRLGGKLFLKHFLG